MSAKKTRVVRGWLVWPLAAAALVFVPTPDWAIETFYARGLYPLLQYAATSISNLVPIALLDVIIGIALVLVLVRFVQLIRAARAVGALRALGEGVRRTLRAAAVLVIVFVSAWGCNYRRVSLDASIGASPAPSTTVLVNAIRDANALAAVLRPRLGGDRDITYAEAAEQLREPMAEALRAIDRGVRFQPGRPKFSLILTPFFTRAGINGMVNPFALESIVHPELLPVERGFVLAHEWAHLTGQADEAEASAVGWLACMKGGPALAYSASLYLILEASGALRGEARTAALESLDAGVREDLAQIAARMQRQNPQVQRAAFRVYDEYLRANRVEDGTASYGRALTLILSPQIRVALDEYTAP